MNIIDHFSRLMAPLWTLLNQTATKGAIDSVDDSGAQQSVSVVTGDGELLDKMERIQPIGLTSVPLTDDEVIVLILNGDRDHAIAIAVGGSSRRPTGLAAGEVAVWRDNSNKIVFRANGDIEVTAGGEIKLGTTVKALVNDTFQAIYDAHTHAYLPGPGLSTPSGPPIPVMNPGNLTTKAKAE